MDNVRKQWTHGAGLAVWLMLAFMSGGVAAAQGRPVGLSITFDEGRVRVEGVKPGAVVALLGVAREQILEGGPYTRVSTFADQQITDDDADGAVELVLEGPLPVLSVWGAVEMSSGAYGVGSPFGRLRTLEPQGRSRGPAGEKTVVVGRRSLEVLVVRGGGAYWESVRDGGEGDEDGQVDRRVEVSVEGVSGGRAPAGATASDAGVVIAVDPEGLAALALNLGEEG